jgi:hypothetical protein
MIALDFKDEALIYPVRKGGYGNDIPQAPVTVPALYEQTTGFEHANNQDAISSSSRLYLPGTDSFVLEHGERLEGMVVQINPFGTAGSEQYFRLTSVTPIRDILLGNQLQHVECELEKIDWSGYVS